MARPVVRLERFPDERIAVITLDRPPLNAIDEQVVTELAAATTELAADSETRAVLVRSALEGVFMAGADIHEFERIAAEGIDRALLAQEVFTRFAELPQPTVAAINGHALGGGLELALACDFRFLGRADGALLGLPEVRLGLLPGAGGTQRLAGLVHFLVEVGELEAKSRDYTVRLARQAPIALRGIKRAIRAAWSAEGLAVEGDAFREVLASEDAQAGVKAFLEGERASFTG